MVLHFCFSFLSVCLLMAVFLNNLVSTMTILYALLVDSLDVLWRSLSRLKYDYEHIISIGMRVADYSIKPSDLFMMLAIIVAIATAFLFCLIESHLGSNARQDTILIILAQSGRSVLIAEGA
jgi:ABC-type transport system involved in multi-copper enzyme maturation permease subunit